MLKNVHVWQCFQTGDNSASVIDFFSMHRSTMSCRFLVSWFPIFLCLLILDCNWEIREKTRIFDQANHSKQIDSKNGNCAWLPCLLKSAKVLKTVKWGFHLSKGFVQSENEKLLLEFLIFHLNSNNVKTIAGTWTVKNKVRNCQFTRFSFYQIKKWWK